MQLQSPSEGIWCALRDLLLQTPMLFSCWGEEDAGQGIKRLAQAYARYHIKERERGEPPRAHPLSAYMDHTQ